MMAMGAPSACSIAGSRRVGTVARRAARSGIVVDRRTEACGTILLTVAAATNTRRSPTRMSSRRRPSTSQRRNPPNSMASTMARSRCVRSAPINSSTAAGDNTRGNVRGVRTTGTRRPLRPPGRRAARLRGTTFASTSTSPRAAMYSNRPRTLDSRRATARADPPVGLGLCGRGVDDRAEGGLQRLRYSEVSIIGERHVPCLDPERVGVRAWDRRHSDGDHGCCVDTVDEMNLSKGGVHAAKSPRGEHDWCNPVLQHLGAAYGVGDVGHDEPAGTRRCVPVLVGITSVDQGQRPGFVVGAASRRRRGAQCGPVVRTTRSWRPWPAWCSCTNRATRGEP